MRENYLIICLDCGVRYENKSMDLKLFKKFGHPDKASTSST